MTNIVGQEYIKRAVNAFADPACIISVNADCNTIYVNGNNSITAYSIGTLAYVFSQAASVNAHAEFLQAVERDGAAGFESAVKDLLIQTLKQEDPC